MRWFHLIIVILFAVVTLIFALQNLMPVAILTIVVYVLGAVTGGSLYALLRKSIEASRSLAD
jgi:hypothetical protein